MHYSYKMSNSPTGSQGSGTRPTLTPWFLTVAKPAGSSSPRHPQGNPEWGQRDHSSPRLPGSKAIPLPQLHIQLQNVNIKKRKNSIKLIAEQKPNFGLKVNCQFMRVVSFVLFTPGSPGLKRKAVTLKKTLNENSTKLKSHRLASSF